MIVKAKYGPTGLSSDVRKMELMAEDLEDRAALVWLLEEIRKTGLSVIRDVVTDNTKPV